MQLLWQWRRLWQLLKLLRLQLPGQIYDGHPKKKRDRNWTLVRPSWAVSLNIWKKKKRKRQSCQKHSSLLTSLSPSARSQSCGSHRDCDLSVDSEVSIFRRQLPGCHRDGKSCQETAQN